MMRTSGSCRRSEPGPAPGFSLLEMLVVLALISIMVALVAPRLAGTVRAIASSGERAETVRQRELLPLLARSQGQPIVAAADAALVAEGLAFPDGWRATALDPLRIAANGICQPGRLRVEGGGTAEEWTLAAPDCRVDPAP